MLNHRYSVCDQYNINRESGIFGKHINEVLHNIRCDIADSLRWEAVPVENDESNYAEKWVQQCKPWEAHREKEYKHVYYPTRGVLDGMTKCTLGQVFGHYSFAQCLLVLGHHSNFVNVFMEESGRQYRLQQELLNAPYTKSIKEHEVDLEDEAGILRNQLCVCTCMG